MLFATALPSAAQQAARPAEQVVIPLNPLPFDMKGYLRRPSGAGPFPGVILIPACDRFVDVADQDWTRVWMDAYQPMQFGRRLWIYPWNIEPPPDPDISLFP